MIAAKQTFLIGEEGRYGAMCIAKVWQRHPDHKRFRHYSPAEFVPELFAGRLRFAEIYYDSNALALCSLHLACCWQCTVMLK